MSSSGPDDNEIPTDAPTIQGIITATAGNSIRVEENPADESGSDKAMLNITDNTRILRRSGETAGMSDLATGLRVSAWVTGPVAESYPWQGAASTIVIEP